MRTGETGLNLIKGYEGLRMSAHYAPSEQWTVGYGHTSSARHGMSVTEGDAERLLREDVRPIETVLADTVRAPLNQNEHDALVSLIFNIGEENWRKSTVLRKLNAGDKLAAAQAFEMWTKARVNGELVALDGLMRRRAAEKSLFLMPTDASLVVPSSDVRPAPECEPAYISDAELKSAPLVNFETVRGKEKSALSPEERAGRARALFAATQAISGDPAKMIISKAEEHADMGITVGAILAGLLAFALTGLGATLLLGQEFPGVAEAMGLSYDRFTKLFENLPMWLAAIGAAMCYFILYILVKRTARHDLKRQRAREIARLRTAE
ncbi:MAG TPA: lysozyme [Parvularculaceae bacterium]|nr:lysozyme [Amphiplicatus sp.]HPE31694.1 lysozyme [Parvularculaceae bacterium]HRX40102.1 lysozyme [Parvularculaceae bacterium]